MRFIIGLVVIGIVFSFYNLYLLDDAWFFEAISRPERHVIKFVSVLVVYSMGVYAFAGRPPGWLLQLWNVLYAALLVLLVLMGAYDTLLREFSPHIRGLGVSLHVFLISPVPYVFVGIIGKAAGSVTKRD
jgi:hypothetical protein